MNATSDSSRPPRMKPTAPSSPTLGVKSRVSSSQRHVFEPWRSTTVRNCSVFARPTVTASQPYGVRREAPFAKALRSVSAATVERSPTETRPRSSV